jgi:uncharacterized membrane protein YqiK
MMVIIIIIIIIIIVIIVFFTRTLKNCLQNNILLLNLKFSVNKKYF